MPKRIAYKIEIESISILDEHANFDESLGAGTLRDDEAVFLYEQMTIVRHYDEIAFKLQRSGRMGTYPQNKGQEAAAAGAGFAIKKHAPGSWLVPCYRENLALFLNGLPMEKILLHWMGDERGNQIPDGVNILPISIPIGTHPLHASGLAWSLKYRERVMKEARDNSVVISFFGDGASSEGDVHEAMNFASALKLPAIFLCQNNRWAISVPISKQMGSETVVQKACAYGMHGVQADGNDIFAMYKVTRDAIERASNDMKPTFIEAVTYRLGDHTTADDARRYRDPKEVEAWFNKDPLIRTRKYLEKKNLWSADKQTALEAKAKEMVSQIVKNAEGIAKPTSDDIFDYTFATLPDEIIRQRDTMHTHSLGQNPSQETLNAHTHAGAR
ncbi:MAG: pyruvate dehydrogenase (acetyl-transferring) E1 component subunit alpha [Phycisphaerales bacterium]|nr:pyruvate dehydrogenase (acetyl-transferring) E1 component subunit alpha [Phycisphaerales bacterium]